MTLTHPFRLVCLAVPLASGITSPASMAHAADMPAVGMTVRGQVVLPDGPPAVGYRVNAVCTPTASSDPASEHVATSEPTDKDGAFALQGLPAGSCWLVVQGKLGELCLSEDADDPEATANSRCANTDTTIMVVEGVNASGVRLVAPAPAPDAQFGPTAIEGRIVDAADQPITGYDVAADCTRPDNSRFEISTGSGSPVDGSFSLQVQAPTGTVCYLRAFACRSMDDCDAPSCEGVNSDRCARVELQEGTTIRDLVVRPFPAAR